MALPVQKALGSLKVKRDTVLVEATDTDSNCRSRHHRRHRLRSLGLIQPAGRLADHLVGVSDARRWRQRMLRGSAVTDSTLPSVFDLEDLSAVGGLPSRHHLHSPGADTGTMLGLSGNHHIAGHLALAFRYVVRSVQISQQSLLKSSVRGKPS